MGQLSSYMYLWRPVVYTVLLVDWTLPLTPPPSQYVHGYVNKYTTVTSSAICRPQAVFHLTTCGSPLIPTSLVCLCSKGKYTLLIWEPAQYLRIKENTIGSSHTFLQKQLFSPSWAIRRPTCFKWYHLKHVGLLMAQLGENSCFCKKVCELPMVFSLIRRYWAGSQINNVYFPLLHKQTKLVGINGDPQVVRWKTAWGLQIALLVTVVYLFT